MVELKKIRKYFSANGIKALDGADFTMREGEIHALLGENGAGKSTLMHIMAGFTKPGGEGTTAPRGSAGTIVVNGSERHFSSPAEALAAGVGMVRQHPHQVSGFLVWESCVTGSARHPPVFVNRRAYRNRVAAIDERFNFGLPLDSPVETLSAAQEQKAAILTLLLRNTQYLVFDEPTAVLSPEESEQLFAIFSLLRDEGKGIVLISHKLEEAIKIADRVTVLRQGKTQICCKTSALSNEKLYELIFGAEYRGTESRGAVSAGTAFVKTASAGAAFDGGASAGAASAAPSASHKSARTEHAALSLKDFAVQVPPYPLVRGINLELKNNTILGIAGVRSSGLETLELALCGFLPFAGTLSINGTKISGGEKRAAKRIRQFRAAGGTCLGTRDEGETLPIRDLLLIHAHRRFQKHGVLNQKKIGGWIDSVMEAAGVPHRNKANADAFSGGQLQRLLLTREMAEQGALLVLSEPGRELDRRYRERLAALLREKAGEKTAVVIFSTDIEELLYFCDEIAVLRDGVVSGFVELANNGERAAEKIRKAMVGEA